MKICEFCGEEITGTIFAIQDKKVCEHCFSEKTRFKKHDDVEHPSHYTQLPIECMDVIKYFDACRGQAIKYIWRCENKGNPVQDLKKAIFWLNVKVKMYEDESYEE